MYHKSYSEAPCETQACSSRNFIQTQATEKPKARKVPQTTLVIRHLDQEHSDGLQGAAVKSESEPLGLLVSSGLLIPKPPAVAGRRPP